MLNTCVWVGGCACVLWYIILQCVILHMIVQGFAWKKLCFLKYMHVLSYGIMLHIIKLMLCNTLYISWNHCNAVINWITARKKIVNNFITVRIILYCWLHIKLNCFCSGFDFFPFIFFLYFHYQPSSYPG